SLSTNYLRDTAAGRLQLPDYKIDDEGDIYLYYREVFCRVPECSKANVGSSTTYQLLHSRPRGSV
ncbi:hypothetical protein BO71DRAFT_401654, partial [Aspergillus ellipticus CBS 707.79]